MAEIEIERAEKEREVGKKFERENAREKRQKQRHRFGLETTKRGNVRGGGRFANRKGNIGNITHNSNAWFIMCSV